MQWNIFPHPTHPSISSPQVEEEKVEVFQQDGA
jgi:hypothetical protein